MGFKIYRNSITKKKQGSDDKNGSLQSIKLQSIQPALTLVYLNGRSIMADQFRENDGSMATLMQILVFCNKNPAGEWNCEKPDMEKSLLDFAATKGFHKKLFDKIIPKIAEVKIDGEPRTASAIIGLNGRYRLVIKDKPEKLLGRCDKFLFKGKTIPLSISMAARTQNVYQQMIFDNLQVLMFAFKDIERLPIQLDSVFQTDGLTLVGMIGMRDLV